MSYHTGGPWFFNIRPGQILFLGVCKCHQTNPKVTEILKRKLNWYMKYSNDIDEECGCGLAFGYDIWLNTNAGPTNHMQSEDNFTSFHFVLSNTFCLNQQVSSVRRLSRWAEWMLVEKMMSRQIVSFQLLKRLSNKGCWFTHFSIFLQEN